MTDEEVENIYSQSKRGQDEWTTQFEAFMRRGKNPPSYIPPYIKWEHLLGLASDLKDARNKLSITKKGLEAAKRYHNCDDKPCCHIFDMEEHNAKIEEVLKQL